MSREAILSRPVTIVVLKQGKQGLQPCHGSVSVLLALFLSYTWKTSKQAIYGRLNGLVLKPGTRILYYSAAVHQDQLALNLVTAAWQAVSRLSWISTLLTRL